MNQHTTPNRPRNPRLAVFRLVPTILLLVVAAMLWINQSKTKDQLDELSVQNSQLKQELSAAQAAIDDFNSGDSSSTTRERLAANRQPAALNPAEKETLFLQEPTVQRIPEGLKVRLAFSPADNIELPEEITLVVRIPASTTSRILSLSPAPSADSETAGAGAIVNASGSLGIIQCASADLGMLAFDLAVSGPVKAMVRGSDGILDFEIDIAPDTCTVRKL